MAKRHQSLIGLSHDHHHGLALAVRLQLGDRALLADGWTHRPDQQAELVTRFYDDELSVHFRLEEEVLFPAIVYHSTDAAVLVKTLIGQHRQMEAMVSRLSTEGEMTLPQALVDLGTILESHIRTEERVLFPEFEKQVPEAIALQIGESLNRLKETLLNSRHQRPE